MGLFDIFRTEKKSKTFGAVTITWARNDPNRRAYVLDGFKRNPYVYRAANLLAQAVASSGIHLVRGPMSEPRRFDEHEAARLLLRPNPLMGHTSFVEAIVINLMLHGQVFVERVLGTSTPAELYPISGGAIEVITDKSRSRYVDEFRQIEGNQTWTPEEMHIIKLYDPEDLATGFSPLQAAGQAINSNNSGRSYITGLLRANGVAPHAITVNGVQLAEDQQEELEEKWRVKVTSAGDRMQDEGTAESVFFQGEVDTSRLGFAPEEMELLAQNQQSAREIAVALGPAPELLGDPENKVYNNLSEAREALYTEHAIPIANLIADELTNWLLPQFSGPEDMRFYVDVKSIEALQPNPNDVRRLYLEEVRAGVRTINEYRAAFELEALEAGDVVLIDTSRVPFSTEMSIEDIETAVGGDGQVDGEPEIE